MIVYLIVCKKIAQVRIVMTRKLKPTTRYFFTALLSRVTPRVCLTGWLSQSVCPVWLETSQTRSKRPLQFCAPPSHSSRLSLYLSVPCSLVNFGLYPSARCISYLCVYLDLCLSFWLLCLLFLLAKFGVWGFRSSQVEDVGCKSSNRYPSTLTKTYNSDIITYTDGIPQWSFE